jgi:cytochrome c556
VPARHHQPADFRLQPMFPSCLEICIMIRKSFVFALTAGILISFGIGVGLSGANDDEGPLAKVMEQVQKHNLIITKGTRNLVFFKKSQKDVEKSANELAKLAKQAKPVKHYLKNAKDEKDPAKKWDELLDALTANSENLGKVVGKPDVTLKEAKDSFNMVKKNCADCHSVFRIDESKY